jgi:hypothetical protein
MKTEIAKHNGAVKAKTQELAVKAPENRAWSGQGVLTNHTEGQPNRYLRQVALLWFLSHTRDNVVFNYRSIPYGEDFGTGDFYTVLSWLLDHNLAIKDGSRYAVPSRQEVARVWNLYVEEMMIR